MAKILSKGYSLNREDLKRWFVKVVMYGLPILGFYIKQLEAGEVDLTALYLFALGSLFDLGRRYIRELEAGK